MRDVVIVEAVRTPIGRRNGTLKDVHPVVLAAMSLRELMRRAGVEPALVEDVVMGCVSQVGEQAINIARNAVLQAGFPIEVPATTVDRQCGSGQQAIHFAANLIQAGVCDVTIAAGVESMSRLPIGSSTSTGGNPFPPSLLEEYPLTHQGISAEMIAAKWGIPRDELDAFSLRSHQRASAAADGGYFDRELMTLPLADGSSFTRDEGIRRDTSVEKLASLPPSFKPDGVITAGNSSQISDGAAALLLMTPEKASELGLRPRARIVAQQVVGVDPVMMLTGPIPATKVVLAKGCLALDDIDLFEVNEAFAPVVLAWQREIQPDMERVNVNGGAIALGHPLGCSGARLMVTLLHELERREARYGLQTMCCGGGLGTATIIERL
ncbi:MAG TPA: thiolase family protein [Ktedonobacterales bacterium]|jgi:acetyl-CoA acetyltransferase family protein|nr:thiolase family protein [Ktedonobacterales bacterium]